MLNIQIEVFIILKILEFYKMDLNNLVLVSHKDGKYAPMFTDCINYLGDNLVLPPNPYGYEGILEHLDEDGVEIHTFTKNGE